MALRSTEPHWLLAGCRSIWDHRRPFWLVTKRSGRRRSGPVRGVRTRRLGRDPRRKAFAKAELQDASLGTRSLRGAGSEEA
jgi:hypothetical protein